MPMVSTGVGGRMAMRAFRRVIEPDYADGEYRGGRKDGHEGFQEGHRARLCRW